MGICADYLDAGLGANMVRLNEERKKQLSRIAASRKRDVLVYAVHNHGTSSTTRVTDRTGMIVELCASAGTLLNLSPRVIARTPRTFALFSVKNRHAIVAAQGKATPEPCGPIRVGLSGSASSSCPVQRGRPTRGLEGSCVASCPRA
jgi:hypothetical protein